MQQNAILFTAVILGVLLVDSSTATARNRNRLRGRYVPICYQKDGVLVRMRGSCAGFFICVEGNAIASSCGSFYRFNAITGHCDHPSRVICEVDTEDPAIPTILILQTAAPTLSDVSPPGFPKYLPKPQGPDEVIADETAGDICYQRRNGELMPKPDSCTQFYVCLLQRPYRRTCPPKLHFNAKRRLCQDPALAQCTVKPMNSPVALELIKFGGVACTGMPNGILLPHDEDCSKFYSCQDEQRHEMECPSALHFSVRHQRCETPKLARCSI